MDEVDIRESRPGDLPGLEPLYSRAFPDEDLLPLVKALLSEDSAVHSLVGIDDEGVIAHVILTICGLPGARTRVALLGPLAVEPNRQRQGVGSALVRAGLARMAALGVARVCVLGDPVYYGRLGFQQETAICPPYPLPPTWAQAWQSVSAGAVQQHGAGTLAVPAPWRRPALWQP